MVQKLINKMVEEKINDDLVCEVEELFYQLIDEIEEKEDFIDELNEYIEDMRYRQKGGEFMYIYVLANLFWILMVICRTSWIIKALYLLVGFVVVADTLKFYSNNK